MENKMGIKIRNKNDDNNQQINTKYKNMGDFLSFAIVQFGAEKMSTSHKSQSKSPKTILYLLQ